MSSLLPIIQPSPAEDDSTKLTAAVKCSARGCVGCTSVVVDCYVADCPKKVHINCHQGLIVQKHKVNQLVDPANNDELYVCSKTCYNKVEKAIVNQPSRIPWDKDGRNGPNDPNNSMKVLLD